MLALVLLVAAGIKHRVRGGVVAHRRQRLTPSPHPLHHHTTPHPSPSAASRTRASPTRS